MTFETVPQWLDLFALKVTFAALIAGGSLLFVWGAWKLIRLCVEAMK